MLAPFAIAFVFALGGAAWIWWGAVPSWPGWTAIGIAAVLATMTSRSNARPTAPRPSSVPGDYRVSDEMLKARFAHLGEGDRGDEWRDFLAKREPGDQIWFANDGTTDAGAGAEYLILMRPYPDDALEPTAPGGEEVARFRTRRA